MMFVFAHLIEAITDILGYAVEIYFWIIIARAILSWVNPDPYNPIVRFLYQATEPVLGRIRRFLPYLGGIDLSPLIVLLGLLFLKRFLIATLMDIALRLRTGRI